MKAENLLLVDPGAAVIRSRSAMELAIKWLYEVEDALVLPGEQALSDLMGTPEFQKLVQPDLWKRLEYIRRLGNRAAHTDAAIPLDKAEQALHYLRSFLKFVASRYEGKPAASPAAPAPASGRRYAKGQALRRGGGTVPGRGLLGKIGRAMLTLAVLLALFFALTHFAPASLRQPMDFVAARVQWVKKMVRGKETPSAPKSDRATCWQSPDGHIIYSNVRPADQRFVPCK